MLIDAIHFIGRTETDISEDKNRIDNGSSGIDIFRIFLYPTIKTILFERKDKARFYEFNLLLSHFQQNIGLEKIYIVCTFWRKYPYVPDDYSLQPFFKSFPVIEFHLLSDDLQVFIFLFPEDLDLRDPFSDSLFEINHTVRNEKPVLAVDNKPMIGRSSPFSGAGFADFDP